MPEENHWHAATASHWLHQIKLYEYTSPQEGIKFYDSHWLNRSSKSNYCRTMALMNPMFNWIIKDNCYKISMQMLFLWSLSISDIFLIIPIICFESIFLWFFEIKKSINELLWKNSIKLPSMKVEYIVYLDILMMTEHLLLKTAWKFIKMMKMFIKEMKMNFVNWNFNFFLL